VVRCQILLLSASPFNTQKLDERPVRAVQAYADALSSAVEASPEQYFWWHKRFSGRDTGK